MNDFWRQFQGRTVADSYVLGDIVSCGADSAVYLIEPTVERRAVVKLRRAAQDSDLQEHGDWSAASGLSHPNLITIYATGTTQLDTYPVDYLVMERAEETLASVLSERALSEQETREMLGPALDALAYLHQNDVIHGNIRPSNVMAVGDTLKLSSDDLLRVGVSLRDRARTPYDPPEAYSSAASPAWDSWLLGALVLQSRTLQKPEIVAGRVTLPPFEKPLSDIGRNTLVVDPEQRWSVPQMVDALEGRPVLATPAPMQAPVIGQPSFKEPEIAVRSGAGRSMATMPVRNHEPARERPKWLIPAATAALLLVLLLAWLGLRPTAKTTLTRTTPPPATPASAPEVPVAPAPVPPVAAPPLPLHRTPAAAPAKRTAVSGTWYVVVATYSAKEGAEKRAHSINARWPKFHAQVVDRPTGDSHHLVVIGANLSEDEADALRKRARSAGVARDVYIKKFAR